MWCLKFVESCGATTMLSDVYEVNYWLDDDGRKYMTFKRDVRFPTHLHPPFDLTSMSETALFYDECKEIYLLNRDGRTIEVIKKPS